MLLGLQGEGRPSHTLAHGDPAPLRPLGAPGPHLCQRPHPRPRLCSTPRHPEWEAPAGAHPSPPRTLPSLPPLLEAASPGSLSFPASSGRSGPCPTVRGRCRRRGMGWSYKPLADLPLAPAPPAGLPACEGRLLCSGAASAVHDDGGVDEHS